MLPLLPLFRLLRPHQWIKNSFVLAGLIFARQWHNIPLLKNAVFIAICFCLLSSAIYIFNDLCDRTIDAQHPLKKHRPLAAGTVNTYTAYFLAALLCVVSVIGSFSISLTSGVIFLTYAALNVLYSLGLKNVFFCDILIIAIGFILRVLAGTSGIGIPPSDWLLICTLALTLFLGSIKRLTEQKVLEITPHHRPNVQNYSCSLLNILISITGLMAILSYTFYSIALIGYKLIITVPLVMYGILRYAYLSHSNAQNYYGMDLAYDLLRDWQLLAVILLWISTVFYILK